MPARCKRFVIGDFFASLSQQHQPIGTASRSSVPPVMHSDVRGDWNGFLNQSLNKNFVKDDYFILCKLFSLKIHYTKVRFT
jgi:hypothetical protein